MLLSGEVLPSFITFDDTASLKFTIQTNDVEDVGVYFVKIRLNIFAGVGSFDDGYTFSVKVNIPTPVIPPPASAPYYEEPLQSLFTMY